MPVDQSFTPKHDNILCQRLLFHLGAASLGDFTRCVVGSAEQEQHQCVQVHNL